MDQGTACANCGAALTGAYCAACGQNAVVHRSLAHFVEELLHGILHFDGKFWRTLPELAFRPGELTRAYWLGKRASVISPLALFLFSVFLFFLATAIAGSPARMSMAEVPNTRPPTAQLEIPLPQALEQQASRPKGSQTIAQDELMVRTGWTWLDDQLTAKARDPEVAIYKIKSAVSKYSFLLVPLSLPFLWLLFAFRSDLALYDHAVFILYSQAFVLLFGTVLTLLARFVPPVAGLPIALASLLVPVHFYRHLKLSYGLSRASALWRTGLLLLFCLCVLVIYLFLILILGLLS